MRSFYGLRSTLSAFFSSFSSATFLAIRAASATDSAVASAAPANLAKEKARWRVSPRSRCRLLPVCLGGGGYQVENQHPVTRRRVLRSWNKRVQRILLEGADSSFSTLLHMTLACRAAREPEHRTDRRLCPRGASNLLHLAPANPPVSARVGCP